MKTQNITIGHSNLKINRMGLGCMGMSEFYGKSDDASSIRTLHEAIDLGVNFFDTADMYGCGHNESLLQKAFQGRWDKVVVATKFGIVREEGGDRIGISGKPDYIRKCCEDSLRRLGRDHLDLYYMHRLDPETPIEEIVGTMKSLVEEGKVRHIGLSEVNEDILERAHAVHPISALQTELSMWSRDPLNGILERCGKLGVTFIAYSPLGRGFLTGKLSRENLDATDWRLNGPRFQEESIRENQRFLEVIRGIASEKKATSAQVALAWVLAQSDNLATIPGTRSIERLKENLGALSVSFSSSELALISEQLPAETVGERY